MSARPPDGASRPRMGRPVARCGRVAPPHSPAARRLRVAARRPSGGRRRVRRRRASRRRRCGRPGGRTQWILATKEVEPNEDRGGLTKRACFDAGERGRVAQFGAVAEDRSGAEKGKRVDCRRARRSATTRETPCAPISSRRGMCKAVGLRSLARDRVEHRADEERISTGRSFEGGAEGFVRRHAMSSRASTAIEARPSGSGRIAAASGSVMSSATSVGSRLSPSGGRVPAATRRGTPSSLRVR